jgi:regulation of enolase protein 1 (concanavalin A-like superfamily)
VRIERRGDLFRALTSVDGKSFRLIHEESLTLSPTTVAGLAWSTHSGERAGDALFDAITLTAGAQEDALIDFDSRSVGPVADAGSSTVTGGQVKLRVAGADIFGGEDEFRYFSRTVRGDMTVTARVLSLDTSDPWAKAGVMVRETTTGGSPNVATVLTGARGLLMQYRPTGGAATVPSPSGPALAAPYWVRVERRGQTFRSLVSTDGANWQLLGTTTVTMSDEVSAGIAWSNHSRASAGDAEFDSITVTEDAAPDPDPTAFRSMVVGTVADPGATTENGSAVTLRVAGRDIWGSDDEFRYFARRGARDVTITTRVDAVDPTHSWAKAGVMIRASNSSQSAHVSGFVTSGSGISTQWRPVDGAASSSTQGGFSSAPYWIRLERRGSAITTFTSPDGASWTQIATVNVTLPDDAWIGIAWSTHARTTAGDATFSELSVTTP